MKKISSLLVFTIFSVVSLFAEHAHLSISGVVCDSSVGEPLPFLNVRLKTDSPIERSHKESAVATVTDSVGRFVFSGLHPGSYTIVVSGVGFETTHKKIVLGNRLTEKVTIDVREATLSVEEVVVSANRNAVSRKSAPVVVGILSPQLFEKIHAVDLSQGLNYQAGLRVENNCQNCGFPQVRINGLEGPYSQLLIDSRPILSALSGVYGLEQIPVSMIDRVEVVRGGGSALFGSNAVAGIINIITREPLANSFQINSSAGLLGGKSAEYQFNANAALVSPDHQAGLSLYQSYRNRDHLDIDGDGYSEIGLLQTNSFGMRGYLRPARSQKLSFEYHTTHEFRRGGNRFDLQPHQSDITEQTDHQINGGGITYDLFWNENRRKLSIYSSLQHIDRTSYYGAGQDEDAYGSTTDFTVVAGSQFVTEIRKLGLSPATLTAGVEYQANRLHDEMPGHQREMTQQIEIGSGFLQNEWKGRSLSLLVGVRMDKHNLIDHLIFSPRVNLLYKPNPGVQGRLTFSTGFRAPQAYDEDLHVAAVGGKQMVITLADNLKEERSFSYSGSVDLYRSWGSWQGNLLAELFYTELRNVFVLEEIGLSPQGMLLQERRNGEGARVYGINIDGKLSYAERVQLQMGFTAQRNRYFSPYTWAEGVAPVKNLLRTPNYYGYLTGSVNFTKAFQTALTGTYTGRMYVGHFAGYIAESRLEHTPQFLDLNLKLSYDFKLSSRIKLQVNGGIQNIFDSRQHDFDQGSDRDSKYFYGPALPRSYYVGIKIY